MIAIKRFLSTIISINLGITLLIAISIPSAVLIEKAWSGHDGDNEDNACPYSRDPVGIKEMLFEQQYVDFCRENLGIEVTRDNSRSIRYEDVYESDDHTITFVKPFFMSGTKKLYFSADSDQSAIAKFFGFTSVESTQTVFSPSKPGMFTSKQEAVIYNSAKQGTPSMSKQIIASITCKIKTLAMLKAEKKIREEKVTLVQQVRPAEQVQEVVVKSIVAERKENAVEHEENHRYIPDTVPASVTISPATVVVPATAAAVAMVSTVVLAPSVVPTAPLVQPTLTQSPEAILIQQESKKILEQSGIYCSSLMVKKLYHPNQLKMLTIFLERKKSIPEYQFAASIDGSALLNSLSKLNNDIQVEAVDAITLAGKAVNFEQLLNYNDPKQIVTLKKVLALRNLNQK